MSDFANNLNSNEKYLSDEILNYVPHWSIRMGITIILSIIVAVIVLLHFIKYPETISASFVLTSENPPVEILAKSGGKIEKYLVVDNQYVKKGANLAIIHSNAKYNDVFELKKNLKNVEILLTNPLKFFNQIKNNNLTLGEVQSPYSEFQKSYFLYADFLKNNNYNEIINNYDKRITTYKTIIEDMDERNDIEHNKVIIYKDNIKRDSLLFIKKYLSQKDFNTSQQAYLEEIKNYKDIEIESKKMILDKLGLQFSKAQLLDQYNNKKKELSGELLESYHKLLESIISWGDKYLLSSPIEGTIVFTNYWTKNQDVNIGDKVFTVIPKGNSPPIARINLPISGSGKIKVGQKVLLKFYNYPDVEYGMVKDNISNITKVPEKDNYIASVILSGGLKTNVGIMLKNLNNMKGTADILLTEESLLYKIIKPFFYIDNKFNY